MAKAVALYTGGITELREVAVREDGVEFSRWQTRDPRFGYRWGAWRETGAWHDPKALPGEVQNGFCTLRRSSDHGRRRLPGPALAEPRAKMTAAELERAGLDPQGYVRTASGERGARFEGMDAEGLAVFSGVELD